MKQKQRKEAEPKSAQPARYGSTEDNETAQPRYSTTRGKHELHKQMQKQGNLTMTRSGLISKNLRVFVITKTM